MRLEAKLNYFNLKPNHFKSELGTKVLQRGTTNESSLHRSLCQIGSNAILIEGHTSSVNPVAKREHTNGKVVVRVK